MAPHEGSDPLSSSMVVVSGGDAIGRGRHRLATYQRHPTSWSMVRREHEKPWRMALQLRDDDLWMVAARAL